MLRYPSLLFRVRPVINALSGMLPLQLPPISIHVIVEFMTICTAQDNRSLIERSGILTLNESLQNTNALSVTNCVSITVDERFSDDSIFGVVS